MQRVKDLCDTSFVRHDPGVFLSLAYTFVLTRVKIHRGRFTIHAHLVQFSRDHLYGARDDSKDGPDVSSLMYPEPRCLSSVLRGDDKSAIEMVYIIQGQNGYSTLS